ncbi:MAG: cobalamin-dependent protein [Thermodesulfobacteriota bacterium]
MVCISSITSTAIKAYEMGKHLRALRIPVIMGGAHPAFLPDEAMEYADFVIRGEGEYSLVELLDHMDKGVPALSDIKGLSYRDRRGDIVHNPPPENLSKTLTACPTLTSLLFVTGAHRIPIRFLHRGVAPMIAGSAPSSECSEGDTVSNPLRPRLRN